MIHRPVTHLPNTCKSTDHLTINSGTHSSESSFSPNSNSQSERLTDHRNQPLNPQRIIQSSNSTPYQQPEVASSVVATSRSDLGTQTLNKRNNQALVTIGICFLNSMDAEAYAEKLVRTGYYQVTAVSHSDFGKTNVVAILADHCLPEMYKAAAPVFRIARDNFQPCTCCKNVSSHSGWSELLQQIELAIPQSEFNPDQSTSSGSPRLRTTHAARRGLPPELDCLTKRELDILQLVGQGMSVRDMAEYLQLADSTVGNHKYRLMKKLGAKTSLELLKIAVKCGLADLA